MVNYQSSVIYKIICNDTNVTDSYIGSTTNFKARKCQHKYYATTCKDKRKDYKLYQVINSRGGWSNWSMLWVQDVKANSKIQLLSKEREYIELLNPTLNFTIPLQSGKEWAIKNSERIKKKHSEKRLICECNSNVRFVDRKIHYKTKKHLEYLENKSKP